MQALGRWLIELSVAHSDLSNSKKMWRSRYTPATWWWVEASRWMAVGILGGSITIFVLAVLVSTNTIHMWW